MLQRLFTCFPSGTPGLALLVLRLTVGTSAMAMGLLRALDHFGSDPLPAAAILVVALFVLGMLLAIGCFTPIAAALAALGAFLVAARPPVAVPPLLYSWPSAVVAGFVCVVLALLGPGAYSVDARLFGRRRLVIPRRRLR